MNQSRGFSAKPQVLHDLTALWTVLAFAPHAHLKSGSQCRKLREQALKLDFLCLSATVLRLQNENGWRGRHLRWTRSASRSADPSPRPPREHELPNKFTSSRRLWGCKRRDGMLGSTASCRRHAVEFILKLGLGLYLKRKRIGELLLRKVAR